MKKLTQKMKYAATALAFSAPAAFAADATMTALQTDVLGKITDAASFVVAIGTAIIGVRFVAGLINKSKRDASNAAK